MTRFKWLFCALLLTALFGAGAKANTVKAASCNTVDVQTAIKSAVAGDTVVVPAGSCTWSGGISISGITLIGAGPTASGTVVTAGMVTMTKSPSAVTRLSGIDFVGSDEHMTVGGSSTARAYIVDNNYFFSNGSTEPMLGIFANGGIFYNNTLICAPYTIADLMSIETSEQTGWSTAPTWGTLDTQGPNGGERNLYFDGNTFTGFAVAALDGDDGSRMVVRYNTFVDSGLVFHGGGGANCGSQCGNDTSGYGGTRELEVYNNTFQRVSNSVPLSFWMWLRGSSGVIANNVMANSNSPDGSSYHGASIRLGADCPNPYSLAYQIGQSTYPPATPTNPLLIFGNTGPGGTSASNFLGIGQNGTGTPAGSCSDPQNYIEANRDYYQSNQWGWTPLAYPHPLLVALGVAGNNPVAAPSNLAAAVN